MNKDDILKKSREENQNGDEREKNIQLSSHAMSAAIGGALCMVFAMIERWFFDRSTTPMWIIYIGMVFSRCILDAIRLRKSVDILLSVMSGLAFIVYTVCYILENLG